MILNFLVIIIVRGVVIAVPPRIQLRWRMEVEALSGMGVSPGGINLGPGLPGEHLRALPVLHPGLLLSEE